MALDRETREDIERFVRKKPRTIQEVSEKVGVAWRTADRYTEQMEQEEGVIRRRTFRKGTRGGLKIVYWNNADDFNASSIQEQLLTKIEAGRRKTDFSPFDIYQCAEPEKRHAFAEQQEEENVDTDQDIFRMLREAQDQVCFFSGNLSWANVTHDGEEAVDVFRELAESGVALKFLGRVDIGSLDNTDRLLRLNEALKRDLVGVRHVEQPLRAVVIDDHVAQFKEMRYGTEDVTIVPSGTDSTQAASRQDDASRTHLFYEIRDPEWVEWVQQVFWRLYRGAIPADRRMADLRSIRNVPEL